MAVTDTANTVILCIWYNGASESCTPQ